MRVFNSAIVLSALLAPHVAHAGWQGTNWGNSPAQVAKARAISFPPGEPHKANPDNGRTYASSAYQAGALKFSAAYEFADNRLVGVQLTLLSGGDCSALLTSLRGKYGRPVSEDLQIPNRRIWRDTPNNNVVESAIYADSFCTVEYRPLKDASASGL